MVPRGHTGAQYNLAQLLTEADGVESSHRLRSAAEGGMAKAHYSLACRYADGTLGVTRDPYEAFRWFAHAAEQGVALAQYQLGYQHHDPVVRNRGRRRQLSLPDRSRKLKV